MLIKKEKKEMRKITFGILGALLLTACGGGGGDTVSQTSSSSRSVSISTSRSYTQQEKENFLLNDMDIDSDGIRYMSLYERYIDRSHGSAEFVTLEYAGSSKYALKYTILFFTDTGGSGVITSLESYAFRLGSSTVLFTGNAYAFMCKLPFSTTKNNIVILQAFDLSLNANIANATILDSSPVNVNLTYTYSDRSLEIGQYSILLATKAINSGLSFYESIKTKNHYPNLVA